MMRDRLQNVINSLEKKPVLLLGKEATIGFDGFIDYIVRVVKSKKSRGECVFFEDMEEFSSYILDKKGKSCTIELKGQMTKIGGNMPIMATALGRLGIKVNCIGAMGMPDIMQEFTGMRAENCSLFSVAEPGITTALEFDDGKIMLADMNAVDEVSWERIKSTVGVNKLSGFYEKSELIGMVNWSEIENSFGIWEGVLHEILPCLKPEPGRIIYFDLADCSKRYREDIEKALYLIGKFAAYGRVVLGMNENESRVVYNALTGSSDFGCLNEVGTGIYEKLDIDTLVIHPVNCSISWNKDGMHSADNFYISQPKLSTGGGDNFNAGFCWAMLMNMDITSSLVIANAVSGFYVKNGYSPGREEVIDFLKEWYKNIT
ncbi:MAG: hypothetical protein Q7J78_06700 [Clostridiales bacterium]|nr:hypothetical protein [Clostridiales bacterium]